jgi:hypothetical protein
VVTGLPAARSAKVMGPNLDRDVLYGSFRRHGPAYDISCIAVVAGDVEYLTYSLMFYIYCE